MNNAVVIVTYNRLELLKECLACVCGQTIPFSRVIVVDNHSTDGTAEYLASRTDIEVIREAENLGGAGGFYDGLQRAGQSPYDWVLIIDDDAMIAPDYMEKLLDYANAHTGIYGLAGKVVTEGHIDVKPQKTDHKPIALCGEQCCYRGIPKGEFFLRCRNFLWTLVTGTEDAGDWSARKGIFSLV